jgi:hypothetical protein
MCMRTFLPTKIKQDDTGSRELVIPFRARTVWNHAVYALWEIRCSLDEVMLSLGEAKLCKTNKTCISVFVVCSS